MTDTKAGGITGKGFTKGDPRINRNGRPKSFDAWRTMLQEIANEPAIVQDKSGPKDANGNPINKKLVLIKIPKVIDGKPVFEEDGITPVMVDNYATNAEMVARQIMSDPKRQVMFIEGAYGKAPQALTVGNDPSGKPFEQRVILTVEYVDKKPVSDDDTAG